MEDLQPVEGLDSSEALARLGGNRSLYLKLLHQFLEQESVPSRIQVHLTRGDRLDAERMAHTLKGVAGTLGVGALRKAAAELEQAIRLEDPRVPEQLAVVQTSLSDLIARLRPALPPLPGHPAQGVEPGQREEVLARMDDLLSSYDSDAQELFETHRALFQVVLTAEDFAAFQAHLSQFALDEAQQVLRQAVMS